MSESNLELFTDNKKENEEFNQIYLSLDIKTKKEIDALEKLEFKVSVLKSLSDPQIMETYQNLNPQNKKKLDEMKIRDRMMILKQMAKKENLVKPQPNK